MLTSWPRRTTTRLTRLKHGLASSSDYGASRLYSARLSPASAAQLQQPTRRGSAPRQPLLVSSWLVSNTKPLCQLQKALVLGPQLGAWRQQCRRQQSQVNQTTSHSKQLFALDQVSRFIEIRLLCLRKRCNVSQRARPRCRRRAALALSRSLDALTPSPAQVS